MRPEASFAASQILAVGSRSGLLPLKFAIPRPLRPHAVPPLRAADINSATACRRKSLSTLCGANTSAGRSRIRRPPTQTACHSDGRIARAHYPSVSGCLRATSSGPGQRRQLADRRHRVAVTSSGPPMSPLDSNRQRRPMDRRDITGESLFESLSQRRVVGLPDDRSGRNERRVEIAGTARAAEPSSFRRAAEPVADPHAWLRRAAKRIDSINASARFFRLRFAPNRTPRRRPAAPVVYLPSRPARRGASAAPPCRLAHRGSSGNRPWTSS